MQKTLSVLLTAVAFPAFAFDPAAMTDAERSAFQSEVRAYLMANPQVILDAVAVLDEQKAAAQAASDTGLVQANAAALFDDPGSWVGGNPDGDVTLVEFMDYRCGYCRKAHAEVAELVATDGNIRFIVKEYPILGDDSILASRFALAVRQIAGDDAYKTAHDALITMRAEVTPETLAQLATDMGLDAKAVMTGMDAPEVMAALAANRDLGQTMNINGTPTFVIDGQLVRGYVPLDQMRQIVDAERQG